MCCEDCSEYKNCEEKDCLKDDCCPKCPEYSDCVGMYDEEDDDFREPYRSRGSNN